MLTAVKTLGDYVCSAENLKPESSLIESSKLVNVKHVFCIDFNYHDGIAVYTRIFHKDYDPQDSSRYLYRVFSHQRYDVTPTSKMTDPQRLKQRFELWFKKCREEYLKDSMLSALREDFLEKSDIIFSDLQREHDLIDDKEKRRTIVTITINEEKHIGDFQIFKDILKREACEKFFSKHKVESKGRGICFVCREEKEVSGFASPFSFYTLDKRGFAPYLLREEAWKRLPICVDCGIVLSAGRDFANTYFRKRFYGLLFYALPNFIIKDDSKVIDSIRDLQDSKTSYRGLLSREDSVSEEISKCKGQVSLTFVFIKPKQSDYFDIMRYVENVRASWIKEIYDALDAVVGNCETPIFKESLLKTILGDRKLVGDFHEITDVQLGGLVRPFFPRDKYEGIYDKYFVDVVSDILAKRKLRQSLLLDAFMRTIRSQFVRRHEKAMKLLVLKSFMLILLTRRLHLLGNGDGKEVISTAKEDGPIPKFLAEHQKAFDNPSKEAVFLEGIIARYLMDVQFANRRSSPFRERLFGLKLDERRVKRLLPEIIEKLREYKVSYSSLERLAAHAFVDADNRGWQLSNEEISYFFVLGMTLAPIFKAKEGEVKDIDQE